MRSVILQGTALTRTQRERLQQQQQVRASFINPVLAQQVADTLIAVGKLKEEGIKPVKTWTVIYQGKGTPSFAEWMGY